MTDTWMDIERNKVWRGMRLAERCVDNVVTGKTNMKMLCSDAGMGKTQLVLHRLKAHNLNSHVCRPSTAAGLCRDMWKNHNEIFFLDDCDPLARSEPCMNIAKTAWDGQKIVSCPITKELLKNEEYRVEDDPKYDPNIPPPIFKTGRKFAVIWCSNKNFEHINETVSKDLVGDFKALVSRGLDPLWIPNDPQSKFDYVLWMMDDFAHLKTRVLEGHRGPVRCSWQPPDQRVTPWLEHAETFSGSRFHPHDPPVTTTMILIPGFVHEIYSCWQSE
jgi:hypothetical protein